MEWPSEGITKRRRQHQTSGNFGDRSRANTSAIPAEILLSHGSPRTRFGSVSRSQRGTSTTTIDPPQPEERRGWAMSSLSAPVSSPAAMPKAKRSSKTASKENLNHLLNFSLPPRQARTLQSIPRRSRKTGTQHGVWNKESMFSLCSIHYGNNYSDDYPRVYQRAVSFHYEALWRLHGAFRRS